MNRKQIIIMFIGLIIFLFTGLSLQIERPSSIDDWPTFGDMVIILFLIASIFAGLIFVFKELRIKLVIISTIIGLVFGVGSFILLKTLNPMYTAEAYIEVLPPGMKDPMSFSQVDVDSESYYRFRVTKATLINTQHMLERLIRSDSIRQTDWFKQFNGKITASFEYMEKHLSVIPQRDSNIITVSMTCGNNKESALIVNELVRIFIKEAELNAQMYVGEQLAERRNELASLKQDVATYKTKLKNMHRGMLNFPNLERSNNPDYMYVKLSELDLKCNAVETDISMLSSHISLLEKSPGIYNQATREHIARDPIIISLSNQLVSQEIEQVGLNKEEQDNSPNKNIVAAIKKKIAEREKEISEQIRIANLEDAQGRMITLLAKSDKLHSMRKLALMDYRNLTALRSEYEGIATQRDDKMEQLRNFQRHLQVLQALHDSPDLSKVRLAGSAVPPLLTSSPKIHIHLISGVCLGLIIGIFISLLKKQINNL